MKNQTGKRIKKEVFVYEKGVELYTTLGELWDCQVKSDGLSVNWEKTEQMRLIMDMLIQKAKADLAPKGITDLDTLYYLNYTIKGIFKEIVHEFDFNNSFYGKSGEYRKVSSYINSRMLDEIVNKIDNREIMSKNKGNFNF